ncbi:MAG: ComEA family DNA-binding protein [Desulfuromonadales bacterium]
MRRIVTALLLSCFLSSVSFAHDPGLAASDNPSPRAATAPLNLNDATIEQLDELPGVGPAMAGRIVAYRDENGPFKQVEQLDAVKGIGARTLEKLRPHLTLE